MKFVTYCVCCGSNNVELFPSSIASFVVDRMTGTGQNYGKQLECQYLHCKDCDFVGTDVRFEREEEFRFYQNYMKEEYCRHRCQYEGRGMFDFLMSYNSKEYQDMRKFAASQFLTSSIDCSAIKSVLDYGGDTGAMIPDELSHANRYVTDVQIRELPNGVKPVTKPEECEPVDLVICGHTLEHVSSPVDVMNDIKRYMKPGALIYVEVPVEVHNDHGPGHQFHEHINRFDLNSLEKFLIAQGFDDLEGMDFTYHKFISEACAIIGRLK
jgi:SAM-dependent methyltransferase